MFSSNLVVIFSLVFIISVFYGVQSDPPDGCVCFDPQNPSPHGAVPCINKRCSRGDNIACNASDPYNVITFGAFTLTLYNIPDQAYFVAFGCNCPGFTYNYNHGGYNGFVAAGGSNDYLYTYENCSSFNPGTRSKNFTRCCNYCCES